jgi:hypothetical protein
MRMFRPILVIPFFTVFLWGASALPAVAQQLQATAETIEVVEHGEAIDAQFRVVVRNGESSAAVNVQVVFEDAVEVNLGNIAGDGSAVSAPERRMIDISAMPTRHVPVPVTVRFAVDGVEVELQQSLVIDRPAPAGAEGEGQ